MAGLFDGVLSPEIQALLSGDGQQTGGGLLGAGPGRGAGLFGSFQRAPDEGLMTQIFGTNDPRDPRGPAMSALAQGLLRGSFADGLEGAQRAMVDTEDRADKRRLAQIGTLKTGLELQSLFDTTKRQRGIRSDMDKLYGVGGQAPVSSGQDPSTVARQIDPQSADQYGTPNVGGIPMFSQLGNLPQLGRPSNGATSGNAVSAAGVGQPGGGYAPADASASASASSARGEIGNNLTKRFIEEARVHARWGDYDRADKLYEQAAKWQPEVKEIGVAMVGTKPVQVITYKDGRQQVSDFAPEPKVHWLDTGSGIQPVDERTMRGLSPTIRKTMTPSEAGNLRVAQDRLDLDRNTPQYLPTEDGGYIALPKRPAPGPIVGQGVVGPNGQPIERPLKPIPPSVNTAIIGNSQSLNQIDRALALLDGQDVGAQKGDKNATGAKAYLPNALLNRIDPLGVDARAEVSDIGSLKIHDRSGAAVTISESPRLMPFVPLSTDDADTLKRKLGRLRTELENEGRALSEIYSRDQGYRPAPVLPRNPGAITPQPQGSTAPAAVTWRYENGQLVRAR